MKMRKYIIAIGVVFGILSVDAQQQYQHSQYVKNPYLFNPAASGIHNYIDLDVGFRQQWAGFTNAPMTYFVSGHTPLGKTVPAYNPSLRVGEPNEPARTPEIQTGKAKHAVGGYLIGDGYGAFNQFTAMGTYAYHLPVMKGYNLSFGVAAGYSQFSFDQNKFKLLSSTDNTYSEYLSAGTSQGYINANAGLWFYSKDLFVGYSSAQLLQTLVGIGSPFTDFDLKMHHFITAGYNFEINEKFELQPSVLAKLMTPAPLSIDISCTALYDKWIWGGFSYRHTDAVIAMFGMNINEMFKFGYSYDFTISKLNSYNQGGHEIILGVMLGRGGA